MLDMHCDMQGSAVALRERSSHQAELKIADCGGFAGWQLTEKQNGPQCLQVARRRHSTGMARPSRRFTTDAEGRMDLADTPSWPVADKPALHN